MQSVRSGIFGTMKNEAVVYINGSKFAEKLLYREVAKFRFEPIIMLGNFAFQTRLFDECWSN